MFFKKNIEEELVTVDGIRHSQVRNITMAATKSNSNLSTSVEDFTAVFIREDETLLSFSVSEKQAQTLHKGTHGTLRYKGSKFISFTAKS